MWSNAKGLVLCKWGAEEDVHEYLSRISVELNLNSQEDGFRYGFGFDYFKQGVIKFLNESQLTRGKRTTEHQA